MAKPKPKRPQWGQQSFGAPTNQDDEDDNNAAEDDAAATLPGQRRKQAPVALDIGLDSNDA